MKQVTLLLDQDPIRIGDGERASCDRRVIAKAHGEDPGAGPRGAPDRPTPVVDPQLDKLEGLLGTAVQLELLDRLEVVHQGARRILQSTLHWSYLGQVERGQRNPTLHNILKLAEVLSVDPGDLVHGIHAPVEATRLSYAS